MGSRCSLGIRYPRKEIESEAWTMALYSPLRFIFRNKTYLLFSLQRCYALRGKHTPLSTVLQQDGLLTPMTPPVRTIPSASTLAPIPPTYPTTTSALQPPFSTPTLPNALCQVVIPAMSPHLLRLRHLSVQQMVISPTRTPATVRLTSNAWITGMEHIQRRHIPVQVIPTSIRTQRFVRLTITVPPHLHSHVLQLVGSRTQPIPPVRRITYVC